MPSQHVIDFLWTMFGVACSLSVFVALLAYIFIKSESMGEDNGS